MDQKAVISLLLLSSGLSILISSSAAYRPIIFMHGLLAGKKEAEEFKVIVDKFHPGTEILYVGEYEDIKSLAPMWVQVDKVRDDMAEMMALHPEGVHLLCFSQGGLICRGVLETLPTHNVRSFISLSSPQGGQFGVSDYLTPYLPFNVTGELYRYFYRKRGQKLSVSNYWNDPHQQKLYYKWSSFLAVINNQSTSNSSFTPAYRENFLRLKNLVLVGGPDDGVITPWQSSQFGYFDDNENVVIMEQQEIYLNDYFGLRTLDQRKSIHQCSLGGIEHTRWYRDIAAFQKCIEPWLD